MAVSSTPPKLYTKHYPATAPKAGLLIVHGLGEHCERYAHVAAAIQALGINVYTFDLRGHGRSEGAKAFVKNMDEYVEDVAAMALTIPQDLPLFVLGHSMGGLVALRFLLHTERKGIKGAVFSGAALAAGEDITPTTQQLIALLAKVAPTLKTVKLDPDSISRDLQTVEQYKTDPLIYREGIKAGTGLAMLRGIADTKPQFAGFIYPVLIMHGSEDKITNIKGSEEFYQQAGSSDKTLKIWEGAYHEIFNETNRDEVIRLTADWLRDRL